MYPGNAEKIGTEKKSDMVTGEDIKYTSALWDAGRETGRATNKWLRSEVRISDMGPL